MIRSRTALALAAATFVMSAVPASAITFVEAQRPGEWLAHKLVGTKVLNAAAEEIGEVKEVVLDAKGQASVVVIGVGGFLGLPEKLVGVPYSDVQIGEVVQSSRVVVVDTNKDALKAAPGYTATDPGTAERVSARASDWYEKTKAKVLELTKAAADKAKEMSQGSTTTTPAPK